jgi:hypothetical protein
VALLLGLKHGGLPPVTLNKITRTVTTHESEATLPPAQGNFKLKARPQSVRPQHSTGTVADEPQGPTCDSEVSWLGLRPDDHDVRNP